MSDGSAITRAIDYGLNCWTPLITYLQDGNVPSDNNHVENLMRPWAMGARPDCSQAASLPASAPLSS